MLGPKRCVFYICGGPRMKYGTEAVRSAQSVKEHLGLPCYLFINGQKPQGAEVFDGVYELSSHHQPLWYLSSTHYFLWAVDKLAEYDQFMYLDTDTIVCQPCMDVFDVLENYDFAICQSPQRDAIPTATNTPRSFTTLEIGPVVFNHVPAVITMLRRWLAQYEAHTEIYGNTDQAPLRDVLWEDRHLRWVALPPEYGFRYMFGGMVNGPVRILHGRGVGRNQIHMNPQEVCGKINESTGIRVWKGDAMYQGHQFGEMEC